MKLDIKNGYRQDPLWVVCNVHAARFCFNNFDGGLMAFETRKEAVERLESLFDKDGLEVRRVELVYREMY